VVARNGARAVATDKELPLTKGGIGGWRIACPLSFSRSLTPTFVGWPLPWHSLLQRCTVIGGEMADSPDLTREVAHGRRGKQRGSVLPSGWFPLGVWKTIDPLYIWSAAAGMFVALVLIAVALVIQTGRVH
jgi:hypothetical protein